MRGTLFGFVGGAGLAVGGVAMGMPAEGLYFSVNSPGVYDFAGQSLLDDDVVRTNPSNTLADVVFSNSFDVNGFHINPDGTILYSTIFGLSDDDILQFDPNTNTTTTLVDGNSVFTGGSIDIDAVSRDASGGLIVSVLADTTVINGGASVGDGDILSLNAASGAVSVLVAESAIFDDGDGDIYGIHANDDGTYLLSINEDEVISGVSFTQSDVILYDPVSDTASLFQNLFDDASGEVDALFFVVPTPGAVGLFAAAGLAGARRRR